MNNNRTVNTEKRPGTSRQEDHQAESEQDTYEGASMSNKTTSTSTLTTRLLEVITSEMERRSIGVDQMAEEAGVSPEEMTRKLAGEETLDIRDLYGISNVLGVKTSELIEVAVRIHERW